MQIKDIHLVNYRGMEDLTVEFGPVVNLIIGDNGAGKSSLLSGLAVALSRPFAYLGHTNFKSIEKEDVRNTSTLLGDATVKIEYHTPVTMECRLELGNSEYFYGCRSNGGDGNFETYSERLNGEGPFFQSKIDKLLNDNNSVLPLLNYQSDRRDFFKAPKKRKKLKFQEVEREQGYDGCVSGRSALETVQNWCFQMELNAFQRKTQITEYETFKRIVSEFVGAIEEKEARKNVYFSSEQWTLAYSDGRTTQPLYSLSAGYQGILCLIMELAYRTVILNPRMEDYKAVEGVVLIDEIDMHLHPRWQWKILGALRATFPNVQFIIATHSPIVISSAEDAKLILMESPNKVKYLPDAYGYNIDDVLELTQGSVNMPQEVKDWRREIEQALDENNLPKAEGIIQAAKDKLGKDSTTVARMRDFLEVNKWIVEE